MAGRDGIRKVTAALARLLTDRLATASTVITCGLPKGEAQGDVPQVNLFLYHVRENPHLRNQSDPRRDVPGQYGAPPLALELSYLVTAYGRRNAQIDAALALGDSQTELESQQLLADVMRVLHEVPQLTSRTQLTRSSGWVLDAELRREWEAVRITPRSLDLDELSKLWTAFKADFQRSVAYQVSILRLESPRPPSVAVPVLTTQFGTESMPSDAPLLIDLRPAAAGVLESVHLVGEGLFEPTLEVVITDDSQTGFPPEPTALPITRDGDGVHFQVPHDAGRFLPGAKRVSLRRSGLAGPNESAESLPFQLLPRIDSLSPQQGTWDGSVTVLIQGALLGQLSAAIDDPLHPTVFFGSYPIPDSDLDLAALPHQIRATLRPVAGRRAERLPQPGQRVPVRIRLNGVESRTWRRESDGSLVMNPQLQFEVL